MTVVFVSRCTFVSFLQQRILSREYQDEEECDAIDKGLVEGQRMPSRSRGDCVRDWCTVWNQEWIHKHARDGFKRRGLSNSLSGDDDEALRGKAGEIWRDLDMSAKRKIVASQIEKDYHKGDLVWSYDFIYGKLLREFPKRGQLDELYDGHDVADPMNEDDDACSDLEEPLMHGEDDADDVTCGQAAEHCRERLAELRRNTIDCKILEEIEESASVRASGEASLEAQPAIRTAAIIDSLLERARDLPTMGEQVRQQLEYARGLAQRQLRKRRSTSAEVDACVKRFCDKQGEQHAEMGRAMKRLHDLSKKHDAAKESALAAKEELQKIKAEAAEQKRKEKEEQEALEALKYFDAKMCGFGLEYGGNQSFQKVRFDFIERVKSKFPPLPLHMEQNWLSFRHRWDFVKSRHIGSNGRGYGNYFKLEMEGLLKARKKGEMNAFQQWYGQQMHYNKDLLFVDYVAA